MFMHVQIIVNIKQNKIMVSRTMITERHLLIAFLKINYRHMERLHEETCRGVLYSVNFSRFSSEDFQSNITR